MCKNKSTFEPDPFESSYFFSSSAMPSIRLFSLVLVASLVFLFVHAQKPVNEDEIVALVHLFQKYQVARNASVRPTDAPLLCEFAYIKNLVKL